MTALESILIAVMVPFAATIAGFVSLQFLKVTNFVFSLINKALE